MPRPVRRLTNMEIDEISLVDKGANQHAMITIAKRAPEEETMPELDLYNEDGELLDQENLADGDVVFDQEGNAYEFTFDAEDVDEREMEEVGKAFGPGGLGFAARAGGAGQKVGNGFSTAQKGVNHLSRNKKMYAGGAGIAGGGAAGGAALNNRRVQKSFSEEVLEELSKAYSDEDRDQVLSKAFSRVEEMEAKYAEAEEIAKSERDLRLTREYISKAAEYNLPVDPAELGPVLYRMAETMDYDDCAVIAKCLEGAGAMIFEEQGYIGGGDNVDIMSQVEAQAVEIGKSASPENVVTVFDQSPDAYNEYLASQRGRY